MRRLAHRIKGAARAVGASPTADLAHQIESLAALGGDDWARLQELRGELSGALEALVAVVRESLRELRGSAYGRFIDGAQNAVQVLPVGWITVPPFDRPA